MVRIHTDPMGAYHERVRFIWSSVMGALTFIDCETTGLAPADGLLLEIAVLQVDEYTDTVYYERTLCLSSLPVPELQSLCVPFVQQMHTRSGLWEALEAGTPGVVWPLDRLDVELSHVPGGAGLVLAGFSVSFDRDWLRVWAPAFAARCSHQLFDITTLRRAAKWVGWDPGHPANPAHRAMADCHAALAYWQEFRDRMVGK